VAERPAEPKRWIIIRMFHHAVERTEAEIAELKAHGLFVRHASGPDDSQDQSAPQSAAAPVAVPAAATAPAGAKEKTTP